MQETQRVKNEVTRVLKDIDNKLAHKCNKDEIEALDDYVSSTID